MADFGSIASGLKDYLLPPAGRANVAAQLQQGDPTTPAAAMQTLGGPAYQGWQDSHRQSVEALTNPALPASDVMGLAGGGPVGGFAGVARKVIPPVNVRRLDMLYEGSAKKPRWYEGSGETFDDMYGAQSNLSRGFNAVTSQQKGPYQQAGLGNRALRLYNEKGIGAIEKTPVMGTQKREMQKMAEMFEQDPMTWLGHALSPTSLKRRDYYGALGGEQRSVIDRHIGAAAFRDPNYFANNANDPRVYFKVQQALDGLAAKRGVTPEQYQASVWISWRQAKGLLEGNEPFREILRTVGEKSPDYQWLVESGVLKGVTAANKSMLAVLLALVGQNLATAPQPPAAPPQGMR